MPRYEVTLAVTVEKYVSVTVDADNVDQAEDKAKCAERLYCESLEVIDVEEIQSEAKVD